MCYEQLLRTQIPKAQKRQSSCQFFVLSGSESQKAAHNMLMKLTPGVNFINILQTAFTLADPKSAKRH